MKAAIVGCGGIAQVHGEALHDLETAELVAAADIRPEKADALTQRFGGTPYASLEEMLEKETIDVLHICTPHVLHTPMAQMAAERKINVFTEKPPVISRKQWTQFQQLQNRVRVGVCFQNRFNPDYLLVKQLLDSGRLGKVLGARAFVTWHREAPYYTQSGWRGALNTEGGGVLINQAIHTMDQMVYLLGTPTAVDATLSNHHLKGVIEVEDTFEMRISFGNIPALVFASTGYCTDSPVLLELCCEKAVVRLENGRVMIRWADKREEILVPEPLKLPSSGKAYWGAGHFKCIEDFYRCVMTGERFRNDIPGVADTIGLLLDAYESARTK